ncbi:MAG: type II toxin-antitoxin system RelE/ParE family toxin [Acidobacteriota bacterium]
MPDFVVAPAAEDDVFSIWCYLVEQAGRGVADRIEAEILTKFADLADTPGKGHRRPDLTQADVLFYTVYEFMIVYRKRKQIQILAVLHAKRDFGNLLPTRI